MRAAPRAASASPPERAAANVLERLPASRRLRSPAQFVAVTSDPQALRAGRRWLSIVSRMRADADAAPVRFGFTASRRHARRSIDRNTAKRVLREAARRHIAELDAAAGGRSVDVVLRLKAAAPAAEALSRSDWKAALRSEADALLAQLAQRLRGGGDAR
ncbi:MAG: ribonuclease P protein component [Burkholderiales bacterium]|jgi:ribonuclease P protein component|nr:ribonuclease P protein component [Burkholderiales bacterium]